MQKLLDMAFYDRLCLMSTTHFGLAAPMINRDREKKALEASGRMLENTEKAWEMTRNAWLAENPPPQGSPHGSERKNRTVIPIIINECDNDLPFVSLCVSLKKGLAFDRSHFFLYGRDGETVDGAFLDTARYEDGSFSEVQVFVLSSGRVPCALDLVVSEDDGARPYNHSLLVNERRLCGEGLEVLCDGTSVAEVRAFGEKLGGRDFFRSYIKYFHGVAGTEYEFRAERKELLHPGRGGKLAGCRLHGRIDLPGQVRHGSFITDLFIVEGIPALLVRMDIEYPYTPENDLLSNEVAVLGHFCDSSWIEAAPIQIRPLLSRPVSVIKYNYQGDLGSYDIADFEKADPRNAEMDSFNNHVTAGFVGVTDGNTGILVAADRSRLNSMAFCPMRSFRSGDAAGIYLNPFGTYSGRQRHHRTYSGGLAQKLAVAASPYHRSLAPAYNGVRTGFLLGIFPFRGKNIEPLTFRHVKAFCDGGMYFFPPNEFSSEYRKEYAELHKYGKNEKQPDDRQDALLSLAKGIPLQLRLKVIWNMVKTWFLSL